MQSSFQYWWASLNGGEITFLFMLIGITTALVRAGLHPTVFALVAWPATTAHELCHYCVGAILGAKPCSFSLVPKKLEDGTWQLGSVSFANLQWWNGPWTALAPMLLAPLAIYLTTDWAYASWAQGEFFTGAWQLGLCALFLQASRPSNTDLRVAAPGLVVMGVIGFMLW